jgi:hypothetical protein
MTIQNAYEREGYEPYYRYVLRLDLSPDHEAKVQEATDNRMNELRENALTASEIMLRSKCFVNPDGQPLKLMPKLELDPALLDQPLYH